ncbi:hypothetical protein V6N11_070895 [Hibiscus sabdariffa]|uniref:Reverse transcriptase zinc-binding domain-containing protein n=1 Tax=Hibiscus sabdariffa TaxID=183260 RepID=A0ABR1ZPC4_9ROSI
MPPKASMGSDNLIWRWEENRLFSTKSAYKALSLHGQEVLDINRNDIWPQYLPQHIRVFCGWLCIRVFSPMWSVRDEICPQCACVICVVMEMRILITSCVVAPVPLTFGLG